MRWFVPTGSGYHRETESALARSRVVVRRCGLVRCCNPIIGVADRFRFHALEQQAHRPFRRLPLSYEIRLDVNRVSAPGSIVSIRELLPSVQNHRNQVAVTIGASRSD